MSPVGEATVPGPSERVSGAPPEGRWRTFADAVALTLGLNVWLSLVLVPAVHVGAMRTSLQVALVVAPLAALVVGIWRRSELVLLGAFPSTLLVPISVTPAIAGAHLYGPVRFAVVGAGVVAYLLSGSFFMAFHEPADPVSARPLASSAAARPPRWQRRERVYWQLTILAVICPALGLYWVNFDPAIAKFLAQMYPGRVAAMSTLLNVAVLSMWLVLYLHVFLGALRPHRTGDRDLVTTLAMARADAARGRPRLRFHVAVACALGGMALLVYLRHL
jgi:hypothetical protein